MLRWTQLLGFRPKLSERESRRQANSTIRLLAITANDRFYSSLVEIAASCGWEIRRAGSIKEGLDVARAQSMPLLLLDWDEDGHDWRGEVRRLATAPGHPCVLLSSRVADENMRQEVIRFQGYDVLPRSADRDQIVRTIRFAWFWITRAQRFHDGAERQEEQY
jgi:DNA-binding response OmpR family regulator